MDSIYRIEESFQGKVRPMLIRSIQHTRKQKMLRNIWEFKDSGIPLEHNFLVDERIKIAITN